MTDIPTLERTRNAHKGHLTQIITLIENHEKNSVTLTVEESEALLARLQKLEDKIETLNTKVYELCETDDDTNKAVDIAHEFDTRLMNATCRLKVILKSIVPPPIHTPIHTPPSHNLVKLPRIDLPSFDGRYENWQSFQDLFIATVENNSSLSGAQKLQYLKTCVKGEAANLIKSFTVTDTHYKEAWGLLTDRYDNKREISNSLIKRICQQPNLKHESAQGLQHIMDVTTECIRSLKVLDRPVDTWDDIIVFIVVEKLDPDTRKEWAMSLKGTEPPTYKELQDFIEQHIRGLQASGQKMSSRETNNKERKSSSSSHHVATDSSCPMCKENHQIYQCSTFKVLTAEERSVKVKSWFFCLNCIKPHHIAKDCPSQGSCRKCGKKHNTLLHFEAKGSNKQPQQQAAVSACATIATKQEATQTLLMTALVQITNSAGQLQVGRAFLDPGSEATIITEECVRGLGLKRDRTNVSITGISTATVGKCKSKVIIHLSSTVYEASLDVEALILPKVTAPMPKLPCDPSTWRHLDGLKLADPQFHKPGKIDILLGADVIAGILRDGVKQGEKNTPTAQHTLFGWVLFGRVSTSIHQPVIRVNHASVDIDSILEKFWKIEELPATKYFTEEEKQCKQHFSSTHSRDDTGRYVVHLPFKSNLHKLGSSRDQATRRLTYLEKRFLRYPEHKASYIKFMHEYEAMGHMQIISQDKLKNTPSFYLPHHFVLKESSSTTKFRVVFDGSAKSSTGLSLNNALMVGPTIQDDLFALLLRFRTHQIALKADITKMYRQFKVAEEDRDYQRILWRESTDQPIREYQLTTVTYGTASAPFLATRCLQQLALDEASHSPFASKVLITDMYVDDLISGAQTQAEAMELQQQLSGILSKGGMQIRKWMSSDPTVLQSIPKEDRDSNDVFDPDNTLSVQALGVQWKPGQDTFTFSTKPSGSSKLTKRQLLSELAKVFDPLGFLSPITITAKLIFQELWKEKVDWDEELSETLNSRWTSYQSQMPMCQYLMIPRCIINPKSINQQLHGFSDASEKAYAAVIYLRSELEDGSATVRMIASKTKVAPVKMVSLPRLELCGALLCTELMSNVKIACKLTCSVTAWTDSTTVLKWLASYPGRWQTFVANRVSKIQDGIPSNQWNYVPTGDNPADCASRGISPDELLHLQLWWDGPTWLKHKEIPDFLCPKSEDKDDEEKKIKSVFHVIGTDQSILTRYSSLNRLLRITALMFRFVNNSRHKSNRQTIQLTPIDLKFSLHILLKIVQSTRFESEIWSLEKNKEIHHKSKLKQLNPFLDEEGVLRVGGRLHHAMVQEDKKHPIILPHDNHLAVLIIRKCHLDTMHGGFQVVFSSLSSTYWITHGRDTVRHLIRKCVVCRRQKAAVAKQLMGSLPPPRVNPGHPFLQSGVDYAGPYSILNNKGRGAKTFKCYFAVFVCFASKAVHLEAVTDLTSDAFIACFKRFSSRRGVPSHMYSDCGTNFVGADKELKQMIESITFNNNVSHYLTDKGTTWNFLSPHSPHHGGIWEAGVKAVMYHLRRVVGNVNLTFEEFGTLLCNVEAILNSRPLCAMSPDPEDLNVLTPGHFLIGRPLTAVPEPDVTEIKSNRLSRWQQVQQISQHFWKRWSSEYLSSLQQRFKWTQQRANLQVGDLVLVHDDQLPPTKWNMARVIKTHPGADSLVRVVTVKTCKGELKRPIAKLSPILPVNEHD